MVSFDRIATLKGSVTVPPDKSITHRAFIFSGMAEGRSVVLNPLMSRDTIATMNAMKAVGVEFIKIDNGFEIVSKGYRGFNEPHDVINCENSGTTARLITGLFAPSGRFVVLTGDNSLRRRPMDRVKRPLQTMGADIRLRSDRFLPMAILPSKMHPADVMAEVSSAQVKSAVILSGLQLDGYTSYTEKEITRNHTETMLRDFGADIMVEGKKITVRGGKNLTPQKATVPGDFSSAAFFIGAAIMFEGSEIEIRSVGLNPTRTGLLTVLKDMGVQIETELTNSSAEPMGNIFLKNGRLKGGKISGEIIPNIIDEIPMLAILGLFAESPLEIRGAEELRVKESDRIKSVVENISALGGEVEEYADGLKVYPLKKLKDKDIVLKSFDDHRIAMVNILLSKRFGNIFIDEISAIDVSFPDFLEKLKDIEVVVA
ncbi:MULTISPECIES: 3-phosphoshikimate 1-carboxyvinyltransferase [Calditerrivibrio]|uniref:3-phosphoshikimate 1-carboxyvinyltransferase n=1 Tax=Calditerrivibrio TaxID=545865 RepID=UPI003C7842F3